MAFEKRPPNVFTLIRPAATFSLREKESGHHALGISPSPSGSGSGRGRRRGRRAARRGEAAEAGDYRFVAPDNGVLTVVFQRMPPKRVVELTERRYARPTVSQTFEGRDRFAPAAAWLAKGIQLSALGRPVSEYTLLDIPVPTVADGSIQGAVLRVDHFGNLVTNIDRRAFDRIAASGAIEIDVGGHSVGRLVETYADIADGEVSALFGSTDHLEFAANSASAGERLGITLGAEVRVLRA